MKLLSNLPDPPFYNSYVLPGYREWGGFSMRLEHGYIAILTTRQEGCINHLNIKTFWFCAK